MQSAHDPGDNRVDSTPSKTALHRYVTKAFRTERRNPDSRLSHTEEEFSLCVAARLLCEFSRKELFTEFDEGQQRLREFERRIEDAMAQDRELLKAGQKASTFKHLPERKLLRDAVRAEIEDRTQPEWEQSVSDLEKHAQTLEDSPVTHAVNAEEAVRLHKALEKLDPRDQEILRRKFNHDQKQVQIARDLNMPPQTVNRRLNNALATLEIALRKHGLGD